MNEGAVVDTSVAVKWVVAEIDLHQQALRLRDDCIDEKVRVYAPYLIRSELGNVLLKGKALSLKRAEESLQNFYSLPINYIEENLELAFLAYDLGQKLEISYYDATFLALAKFLTVPLVTNNPKHQRSIRGIKAIPLVDYR